MTEEKTKPEKTTKTWKTAATFSSYEEASQKKGLLLANNPDMEVKIRRSHQGPGSFRVKTWQPKANNKKKK